MTAVVPEKAPELPAAGSSFYLGMRILPQAQREAMYAVYDFCRAVDDVADAPGPREERKAALEEWRDDVASLFEGKAPRNLANLSRFVGPYGLRRVDLDAVIDGMEMDVDHDIQAPDWSSLDLYCDRVASAVGRMSARIFGLQDGEADLLAHHLGRALQLTNILRDLDEDAGIGRLYLPREELEHAGIAPGRPETILAHPRLGEACLAVAARARTHFAEADRVMARQPRKLVRAPRLMEAAYRSILDRLVRRGFAPPRKRVRTDRLRLLGALLRHGFA